MKTAKLIRIPRAFYDNHVERALPAPEIVRQTKGHYFIDATSEELVELLSDAEYYADPAFEVEFGSHLAALILSARATERAILQDTLSSNESYMWAALTMVERGGSAREEGLVPTLDAIKAKIESALLTEREFDLPARIDSDEWVSEVNHAMTGIQDAIDSIEVVRNLMHVEVYGEYDEAEDEDEDEDAE